MTSTVSGEDQPDPRVEAAHSALHVEFGTKCPQDCGEVLGRVREVMCPELVAAEQSQIAFDSVDRAAGIRRVTEVSLKCPACECYYDANGVSCYRESDVDWVCTEMSDRS